MRKIFYAKQIDQKVWAVFRNTGRRCDVFCLVQSVPGIDGQAAADYIAELYNRPLP